MIGHSDVGNASVHFVTVVTLVYINEPTKVRNLIHAMFVATGATSVVTSRCVVSSIKYYRIYSHIIISEVF